MRRGRSRNRRVLAFGETRRQDVMVSITRRIVIGACTSPRHAWKHAVHSVQAAALWSYSL